MANTKRAMTLTNWIATAGVTILLVAFFLNIAGKLTTGDKRYASLNLIGGVLSAYASWLATIYPFVILNIIWSFTAFVFLVKTNVPRETKQNTLGDVPRET